MRVRSPLKRPNALKGLFGFEFFRLLLDLPFDVPRDLVDRKARRLLAGGIIDESLQELRGLERHPAHQIRILDPPIVILIRDDIAPLEWVHAQVVELRYAQARERLVSDGETSGLFHLAKHRFPGLVTERNKDSIVVEISEVCAFSLGSLPGQIG
jgi:hypothetical protein